MRITDHIDLFYPSAEAKASAAERRKEISESGAMFAEDLKLDEIKRLISLGGSERFVSLAEELSEDIETIEYRLDCLEDFLNIPELSERFRRIVAELAGSRNSSGGKGADSFYELNLKMDELTFLLGSIKEINDLYRRISGGVKSAAMRGLFGFFGGLTESEEFVSAAKDLAELRATFSKSVKSVKVGINFDESLTPDSAGLLEISSEKIRPRGNAIERMVFKSDGKDRFSGEEHFNSITRRTPPDIDTALFKELSDYTKEFAAKIASALESCKAGFFGDISVLENQLDYYIGAAAFIKSARARGMPMCRPKLLKKSERRAKIKGIFDLVFYRRLVAEDALAKLDGKIVLNDIELGGGAGFYMVTGANNGGKTTFARALGICQVLAQAGLYVPAESAEISVCDNIYTHFPRDERAGIDASRFTEEIKDLKGIVCRMTEHSLVILNESLQSTTPEECLKIAAIHLELFAEAGVRGVYVTHLTGLYSKLSELNARGLKTKLGSLVAAADEDGEKRLYKMVERQPSGESLAMSIYRKFGATEADLRAVRRIGQA